MKYGFNKVTGIFTGVYSPDFSDENLGFLNIAPSEDLIQPKVNDISNPEFWKNGFSGYELVSAKALKEKNYIKKKYEMHRKNGWNEYQEFRAEVVMDISKNIITEIQAFQLEDYLKESYDKINNTGDWKTAKFILQNLSGHPTWMESYINSAIQRVDDYIIENYDI